MKLTYFNIEAAAEKVRLALVLTSTPFEDVRIQFTEWGDMKPTTKYGVLPIMEVDGKEMHQSMAQLRYAASLGDGSLLPKVCAPPLLSGRLSTSAPLSRHSQHCCPLPVCQDPTDAYKVELMVEMCNDFAAAWRPCLYISMRPHLYGYGDDFEGDLKTAKTKEMREKFIAETLPVWMKYFSDALEEHGGAFAAGPTLTIADCIWYPQLNYYTKGIADL